MRAYTLRALFVSGHVETLTVNAHGLSLDRETGTFESLWAHAAIGEVSFSNVPANVVMVRVEPFNEE